MAGESEKRIAEALAGLKDLKEASRRIAEIRVKALARMSAAERAGAAKEFDAIAAEMLHAIEQGRHLPGSVKQAEGLGYLSTNAAIAERGKMKVRSAASIDSASAAQAVSDLIAQRLDRLNLADFAEEMRAAMIDMESAKLRFAEIGVIPAPYPVGTWVELTRSRSVAGYEAVQQFGPTTSININLRKGTPALVTFADEANGLNRLALRERDWLKGTRGPIKTFEELSEFLTPIQLEIPSELPARRAPAAPARVVAPPPSPRAGVPAPIPTGKVLQPRAPAVVAPLPPPLMPSVSPQAAKASQEIGALKPGDPVRFAATGDPGWVVGIVERGGTGPRDVFVWFPATKQKLPIAPSKLERMGGPRVELPKAPVGGVTFARKEPIARVEGMPNVGTKGLGTVAPTVELHPPNWIPLREGEEAPEGWPTRSNPVTGQVETLAPVLIPPVEIPF